MSTMEASFGRRGERPSPCPEPITQQLSRADHALADLAGRGDAPHSPHEAASDRRDDGFGEHQEHHGDQAQEFVGEARTPRLKKQPMENTVNRFSGFAVVDTTAGGRESATLRGFLYDWIIPLGMVLMWLFLNRWILPQLGYPGCSVGSCGATASPGHGGADADLRPGLPHIPQGVPER